MTSPVRPPSDIRWQCNSDQTEHNNWTNAWNHRLDEHPLNDNTWTLLGTPPVDPE